jgi:POT family proton-dependent oligopeptide transporter
MFLGIVQYLGGWKHLGNAGMDPVAPENEAGRARQRRQLQLGIVAVLAAAGLLVALSTSGILRITAQGLGNAFGVVLLLITVVFFLWLFLSAQWTPIERKQLIVVLVLFLGATVFWSVFEQQGSSLNLFAQRNTDTRILGHPFPPSWFQSVESVFLVLLAPVFAWVWIRLGKHDPSSPAKFSMGLFFVAAGFGVMFLAARLAQAGIRVSPLWLVATFGLHAIGELLLSPVGMSAITRLAPARIVGLTMGVWYLALSVGSYLGGRVASLYETFTLPQLFGTVGLYALTATVLMALLIKPIQRMLAR